MSDKIRGLITRAARESDRYVLEIQYEDRFKDVTTRTISPIRFVGRDAVLALCLSREDVRQFALSKIKSAKLKDASDALMPEPIERLADG